MTPPIPLVDNELDVLADLLPLDGLQIIEPGCGPARLARDLIARYPGTRVTGLEVDQQQLAKNLARPTDGLTCLNAGAQQMPVPDGRFDLAMMLKSLHHVPLPLMDQAIGEVHRVLKPGGHFYVSEPVYDGPLNDIVRLFNDEGVVRAAAQAAVDRALATGRWVERAVRRFDMPVHFDSVDDFELRMMRPTFADHHIDDAKLAAVRQALGPHLGPEGADFTRPMLVRLLQKA